MKPVLVDTGFLVALYDKSEPWHDRCLKVYETIEGPLLTCEAVITEAMHLLRRTPGAADGLLASIDVGALEIPFQLKEFAVMVRQTMQKYRDLPADFADACLICMAEELGASDILTLDSDFHHYRWKRNRPFRLLIPLE